MKSAISYGSSIRCPLCNDKTYTILYPSTLTKSDFQHSVIVKNLKNTLDDYSKHAQLVRCMTCSLVYTNPMEDLESIYKGYQDVVDEEYLRTEEFRKVLLTDHLRMVSQFKQGGKMLDIGCFAGYFLELAKKNGWQTDGIEPSVWAGKEAKKRGTRLVGKSIETAMLPENYYDAITLWDVIEHLPNPTQVMQTIKFSIKKRGIVAMGTPNIDSAFARMLGRRWPFLIRMHLILYSPKTLKKLFEDNGFRVIYTKNYARVFPIWYILDRFQFKSTFLTSTIALVKKIPILPNIPITLRVGDSFVMIAEKL